MIQLTFTEAVWGNSTFLVLFLKYWLGLTTMSHGRGAEPFSGPSTGWPMKKIEEQTV